MLEKTIIWALPSLCLCAAARTLAGDNPDLAPTAKVTADRAGENNAPLADPLHALTDGDVWTEWRVREAELPVTITLTWPFLIRARLIRLYSRTTGATDPIDEAVLTLFDGSGARVWSAKTERMDSRHHQDLNVPSNAPLVMRLTLEIRKGSPNPGLAGIEVYEKPPHDEPPLQKKATATSDKKGSRHPPGGNPAAAANDGDLSTEWTIATEQLPATLTLRWPGAIPVRSVAVVSRTSGVTDVIREATLRLLDRDGIEVWKTSIREVDTRQRQKLAIPADVPKIRTLELRILKGGPQPGVAEIEVE
ncbi:MAG: hypothetical protein HYR85_13065 [Planctomycetes bacterium]|nr:hypothetical protein [Planctomycetota bacterium]MBI3847907.1 hypothetical protein [Planctomycetota bacterium]